MVKKKKNYDFINYDVLYYKVGQSGHTRKRILLFLPKIKNKKIRKRNVAVSLKVPKL